MSMLHMVVNTHNPESCAFRSEDDEAALAPGFGQVARVAQERGAALQGSWVNTASHTIFLLIDAPNAHLIDEVIRESGLTGRTHTQVFAIQDTQALLDAEGPDR